VQLDIIADHAHLWLRTRAALKYLHTHFRHEYDWFYKCDDDTYVIVENMRNYLKRPEIIQRFHREPMQMGHRFHMPEGTFNFYIKNETLRSLWHSRYDRMVYNSGGAGYVMNRLYLDEIVEALPEWTCLPEEESGTMPEDAGVSFCMMWHDVYPWDARDHRGRERWHAFSPGSVFQTWDDPDSWYVKYHATIGGLRSQSESAAPDSVAFHYVKPPLMYHMERSLYFCRTEDEDLETFNHRFGLAIGEDILET
jgi:glycoprotein-N-acetylgalactosamine 3-beta-galactosyltransferase